MSADENKKGEEAPSPTLPPPYSTVVDDVEGPSSQPEKQAPASTTKHGFFQLFRYADWIDIFCMIIGTLLALGRGAALPASLLYFSKILNAMMTYSPCWDQIRAMMANGTMGNSTSPHSTSTNPELDKMFEAARHYESLQSGIPVDEEVGPYCRDYAVIGLGMFVAGIVHCSLWTIAGQRQLYRVRLNLFRAMLAKDAGWFDARRSGALNSILFDQVRKMEDGMSSNIGMAASWIGVSISGFVVAFVKDWLVSIVIFSLVPALFIIGAVMIKLVRLYSAKQSAAYTIAGSIANEVIGNARTVLAFNKQEYEVNRYGESLGESMRMGSIKTVIAGVAHGFGFLIMNCICGLAFWWGNNDVNKQAGGNVMMIIFCMMMGAIGLASASPNFEIIATAIGAADEVFTIIDEEPKIDNFSEEGLRPESITGNINFEDVAFAYPSRPDRHILKKFSLEVKHGQTVALVGPSGCGKSTTVQMLLRFYDAIAGKVTLDGVNIQDLNVRWLRHNIGLVSQEPVLFNTTIKQNIRLGALDRDEVPDEDIIAACKLANAHNFISTLPEGYDTMVGERGAQLSGGQKQRIAIARALICNPKILVLDEATSALDTTSEKVVQEALDNARVGRTTLVIAHRLSTIRNADKIAVIDGGVVAELGNHSSLLNLHGLYYRLVRTQEVEAEKRRQQDEIASLDEDVDAEEGVAESSVEVNELDETKSPKRVSKRRSTRLSMRNARAASVHEAENGGVKPKKTATEMSDGRLAMLRVALNWGRPELVYLVFAAICAFIEGGVTPAFAIIMSEFTGSFCPGGGEDKFSMLIGITIGVGAFQSCLKSLEHWFYSVIGERLTKRVRTMLLGKFLRMDAAWLDKQEHQPSVLTTILATDCTDIQGISGIRICIYLVTGVTLLVGIIYSLVLEYRIALAMMGLLPFVIVSSYVQGKMMVQGGKLDAGAAKETSIVAMDALSNIRTVMSLGAEPYFLKRYTIQYRDIRMSSIKANIATAPLVSLPMSSTMWAGGITFSLGSYLMRKNETTFLDIIRIYTLITLCGTSVGRQNASVADEGKACESAKKILDILNYETQIDREDPKTGESLDNKELNDHRELLAKPCMGKLEFKSVSFCYPNRPNIQVLKDVSFTVEPGQQVALCGTSGGGKSTIIQLVQRLYDISSGEILIDGVDIRKLNIRHHRSNIGLVSQEPVLFALTIEENICYGSRMPDEKPPKEQIDKVCHQANAHSFMQKLPEGFNTFVGERGAQLSGGQKQRIAIARALVRNPSILLLDEATSALDTESERVVQEALDVAAHGRTSLTIAHRLSTIQNADKILVLDSGIVAEQGTHAELMAKQGIYYDLQIAQSKEPVRQKKIIK